MHGSKEIWVILEWMVNGSQTACYVSHFTCWTHPEMVGQLYKPVFDGLNHILCDILHGMNIVLDPWALSSVDGCCCYPFGCHSLGCVEPTINWCRMKASWLLWNTEQRPPCCAVCSHKPDGNLWCEFPFDIHNKKLLFFALGTYNPCNATCLCFLFSVSGQWNVNGYFGVEIFTALTLPGCRYL